MIVTPVFDRARRYILTIPPAVSGQGGDAATFNVARVLIQGFALSHADALCLLREWNQACQPPWSDRDLLHKIRSAGKSRSSRPSGYLLGGNAATCISAPVKTQILEKDTTHTKPKRIGFGPGTVEQLKALAVSRPFGREGLEWAQERGTLVFGDWHGEACYGVTDKSGRVLELRRIDGQPFPAITEAGLAERKSHAISGSQKKWPVGILEAEPFPCIALVEGVPDFLQAHYEILWAQSPHHRSREVRCAPVAMLSASPSIADEALPLFRNKVVRIFPHSEQAGLLGGKKWREQLLGAGAAKVDLFDFSPYRKADGRAVNDLCDWWSLRPDEYRNDNLWRIFP